MCRIWLVRGDHTNRDTAFAKALKSIVGIGEHLGKTEEDTYVTHVDQVKQDNDITITLKMPSQVTSN